MEEKKQGKKEEMKFLIIGDVVGEPGRNILFKYLEKRKKNYDWPSFRFIMA